MAEAAARSRDSLAGRIRGRAVAAFLCGFLAAGCASTGQQAGQSAATPYDPLEPLNRSIYRFNEAIDNAAFEPVARGYRRFVPAPVRRGFSNVFSNFATPSYALNNFLQGKPKRGFNELGRFLFNSTLGIGGIFDVATAGGMESYDESFGETLAVWGVKEGPYLVLPILGPRSMLDAAGLPLDYYSDINTHLRAGVKDKLYLFRLIDKRARLLAAQTLIDKSNDPYIALRESYRQNREYKIHDGDVPPDPEIYNDEMFNEFFDQGTDEQTAPSN